MPSHGVTNMKTLQIKIRIILAALVCMMAPLQAFADITNTASTTYKDAGGTSHNGTSNTVTVTVTQAPVITSTTTASGDIGAAMSYQITATNSPTSFNATGLPAGVTVNTTTGLISGTPTASGVFTVTLTATNAGGSGTATLTLTIRTAASITLTKSSSASSAISGSTLTFTIAYQNNGGGAANAFAITDTIPTGSTLVAGSISNGGILSGSTITWTIGNLAAGASGQVTFQVKVN